jgi:F420-non-reducing hydrogenase iron-sulfur subunit
MDPQFVMHAFAQGADGVLIGGCHPNDCHYLEGNCAALRRFRFLRRLLGDLGIHPDRLRLEWISASEADKVRWAVGEMVDQLRRLGPLALPDRLRDLDAPTLAYSASQEVVHEQ